MTGKPQHNESTMRPRLQNTGVNQRTIPFSSRHAPLLLLWAIATASAQSGGPYTISRSTIDSGAGTCSAATYSVTAAIGQPDALNASGPTYTVLGGFWTPDASTPSCPPMLPPLADPVGMKNRYLTLTPQNAGELTALAVTTNGWSAWVAPPTEVTENSGNVDPAAAPSYPRFWLSSLQCSPHYDDWTAFGTLYVYHRLIGPADSFDVSTIHQACDVSSLSHYSAPLNIPTADWCDVISDCTTSPCGPPNGVISVLDAVAVLDKFANVPGAPIKARTDVEPATPDMLINITDVSQVISAFRGDTYPFGAPGETPCAAASSTLADAASVDPYADAYRILDPTSANVERVRFDALDPAKKPIQVAPTTPSVQLVPHSRRLQPGGWFDVDVFATDILDLSAYQVSLRVSGGTSGSITVSQLSIDTGRPDYAFAQLASLEAVDDLGQRMGAASLDGSPAATDPVYLGTFTLSASADAAGSFTIGLEQSESGAKLIAGAGQREVLHSSPMTVDVRAAGDLRTPRER